jgi:hypothetical protein
VQDGSSGRRHRVRERNARQEQQFFTFFFHLHIMFCLLLLWGKGISVTFCTSQTIQNWPVLQVSVSRDKEIN